ncbi:MAG: putative rane protein [Candidatus Saccharibacteria bacterium]|nr:putative rane protein [Candidatus Saccharibacteria bacterium]
MNTFAKTLDTTNSPLSGLTVIALLGGFAALFGLVFYIAARQKKAMAVAAAKNGWQALATDDTTLGDYVPSYLRNRPDSVGHSYQMAYNVQAQGIVFFRYDDSVRAINGVNNRLLTTTDNQSMVQQMVYAIAAFRVPQSFGQVLVLNHSRFGSIAPPAGLQKFTLEGDFSEHFDVYAPQGSAPETLSVLTPDVMAYLLDLGQRSHWNIEINGSLVTVEGDANLISPTKISNLLDYARALQQKLATKPIA